MPIQSHSKDSKGLIIFSVMKPYSGDSYMNHEACIAQLNKNNIKYKEVTGVYKGIREVSFIIDVKHLDIAVEIAKEYDQESILILEKIGAHGMRKAALYYPDSGDCDQIGWFRSRPGEIATKQDSYTYDAVHDKYFVVEADYTQASQIN
jgi:hypothetical protein